MESGEGRDAAPDQHVERDVVEPGEARHADAALLLLAAACVFAILVLMIGGSLGRMAGMRVGAVGNVVMAFWIAPLSLRNLPVTQATTDAVGTTALGSKSPRIIPLSVIDVIAANAAAGTVATRVGDSYYPLETPLVVHPGEFISVGCKTLQATAAITAGVLTGSVGYGGYWD